MLLINNFRDKIKLYEPNYTKNKYGTEQLDDFTEIVPSIYSEIKPRRFTSDELNASEIIIQFYDVYIRYRADIKRDWEFEDEAGNRYKVIQILDPTRSRKKLKLTVKIYE